MKLNDLAKMVMRKPNQQRFIEIDMLRGVAILLMIFGHFLWDLYYFGFIPLNSSIYAALQSFVPQLFFIFGGISVIVIKKTKEKKTNEEEKKK